LNTNASFVISNGSVTVGPNSTFSLFPNASLIVSSNTSFFTPKGEFFGNLEVYNQSSFYVGNVSYAPTRSTLQTLFHANSLYIPSNVAVNFPNGLIVNVVNIQENSEMIVLHGIFGAQVTVNGNGSLVVSGGASLHENFGLPAINGLGFVEFLDGFVTIQNWQPSVFNGTVAFADVSEVYISNLTLYSVNFEATSQELIPNITGDGLIFMSDVSSFGNILAQGQGITTYGILDSIGNVNVSYSTLKIGYPGALIVSQAYDIIVNHSTIFLESWIQVTDLKIHENSTLSVTSSRGIIYGDLSNHGILIATTGQILDVQGNFTQHHFGKLSISIATGTSAPIVVNGTVQLSGNVEYTLSKKPVLKSTEKYLVLTAASNVNGTFESSASPTTDSSIQRNLKLQYNEKDVYIIYDFHPDDVDIWMWAVLGVGIAVIIVVIVVVVIKCRRRRAQYERVPH